MKTIIWDVDDVLNDLMYYWLTKKWLPEHPDCKVCFEQITENPPHRIINATEEEYQQSLDAFRVSKDYQAMKPNKEVLAWFEKYGDKARHLVLTAVPLKMAHISAAWVTRHFGQWIRGFHFIPSKRSGEQIPEYDKNKPEFLKRLGEFDLFIEDTEKNIEGIEKKSLLVSRPWNKSKDSMQDVLVKITKRII